MVEHTGRSTLGGRRAQRAEAFPANEAIEAIKDELGLIFDMTPANVDALRLRLSMSPSRAIQLIDALRETGFLVTDPRKLKGQPRRYYVIEEELALDGWAG